MLYIVIPVYNRKRFTYECLSSLYKQTYKDYTIIVIDDGSSDGTSDMINAYFPEVVVIKGDGNLWWAEATNLGISYAVQHSDSNKENFVLTLNNDLKTDPNYIFELFSTYKANEPCIVGSVSVDYNEPERLTYSGVFMNMISANSIDYAEKKFKNKYSLLLDYKTTIYSDSLPGRGMLIPFCVFTKINTFDSSNFVHHLADIDFSVRAKSAGFKLVISPKSIVYDCEPHSKGSLSINQFLNGLFSIKSSLHLKPRFHFALRHSPITIVYFLIDIMRVFGGYLLRKLHINLT